MDETYSKTRVDIAYASFEKKLIDNKVIRNYFQMADKPEIKLNVISNMLEKPSEFNFTEDGELYYVFENGEKFIFDPSDNHYERTADKLLSVLADCEFDVECGGVESMQREATAI